LIVFPSGLMKLIRKVEVEKVEVEKVEVEKVYP